MRNMCGQNSPELNFYDIKESVRSKCSHKTFSILPITVNDLYLNLDVSKSMEQTKLNY